MKQFIKTGKKALSVFMTIMMLMTAWVWVAPEKASAATAGNYYVEITWNVYDTKKYSKKFTGTETENGARAGLLLYYKTNNGTGTQQKVYWDIGYEDQKGTAYGTYVDASTGAHTNSKSTHTTKCIISGFPTAFYATADSDYFLDGGGYEVTKIVVGKPSTNSLSSASISNKKTLWEGTGKCETTTEWKWFKITADGTGADGKLTVTETGNDSKYGVANSTTENWQFPTPTSTTTYTGKVDNVSVPKSGTLDAMTVKVIANDQYGVQMGTPTWTVKGSVCGTTGISVSPTSGDSTTVKLTNAANVTNTTDTQTGTITATWGNAGSLSDTFTITDSYYTATFNYQTQNADNNTSSTKTETRNGYHGDSITAPNPPQYYDYDYLKTFSAWNPTYSSTITKDVAYTATYTEKFVDADYSEVDKAIAAVNDFKADWGAEYDAKFTYATRMAVDAAVNAVIRGKGRTEQTTVTKYATDINTALGALEPNKYAVIFLDKDGAILLYEKNVEYKQSVKAPEYSTKYYDSTNHYTFTGWDTTEYTSVIDDLVIQPVFTAEAHVFTESTVESTCVQKGATKYTCACGYSYIDGETEFGEHQWADEFTVDLEPTCVLEGSKSIHCTLCDAQKDITPIEALGHSWEDFAVAVSPTCDRIGISSRVCAEPDCRFCEHLIIEPTGHSYEKTTVPATCTKLGYDEYTCANCGHSYRDNYTEKLAPHNYGEWETVSEAHCGVAGVKKQTCNDCGYVNIGSIDALEHDDVEKLEWDVIVEDTCEYEGYRTKTCSKCNNVIVAEFFDDIADHDYKTETTPATCSQAGYTVTTCNRNCGYEKTTVIQTLGHDWDEGVETEATCTSSQYTTYTCKRANCGETKVIVPEGAQANAHVWEKKEETPATCKDDGSIEYKCKNCNETKTDILPKLGHAYGDWEVVKNATNTEDGQWKRVCRNDEKHVEYLTIPKGGHTWSEGKTIEDATCTAPGKMLYFCETQGHNCGITLEVTIPATGHTEANKITQATCTAPGSIKTYCSVCDSTCANPFTTTELPIIAHTFNSEISYDATCTTSGYTVKKCECGFEYKEYNEAVPAKGHSYKGAVTKAATCTEAGTMTYTCENDASHTYTEPIDALGHSYDEGTVVQNQDCVNVEKTEYKCTCGASYVVITKEAKGHTYGNWETVTAATADKNGVKKRICACGDVEYDVIAPIGNHTFNEEITTNATCTTKGLKTFTCTAHNNCTANYTAEIPATGHTQEISYTAPTCISAGSSKIICSVCKDEILSEAIPATGIHDFSGEGVKADATCTAPGTMTYTCKNCTATKVESIPAKGHTFETTVTDATCTTEGSVVTICTSCNDATVTKTTVLTAKNHKWNNAEIKEGDKASCEGEGTKTYTCELCSGTKTETVPANGHSWSDWTKTDATNDTDGKWERKCSNCQDVESVVIPKGNHNLVYDSAASSDATCTTEGKKVYKCTNHENCTVKVELTLDKLQHTVAQRENSATCTTEGSVEAYCSVCNDVLSTEVIPVKAHNFVAQDAVAPTCTTAGYTPHKCSACGFTYNVFDYTQATGHNFDDTIATNVTTTDATCTADGSKVVKCSACNATKTEVLPKKGHTYVKGTVTNADCTTAGTEVYTCACGDTYTKFIEAAKGHTYGDWTETQAATSDKYGIKERICSVCKDVEIAKLAPIGDHNFTEKVETPATCTTKGEMSYTCSVHTNCSANYTAEIPATGHTAKIAYIAPTCNAVGYSKILCENCDAVIKSETIPATGVHDFSGEGEETTAPGCTTEGELTYTCKTEGCNATKTATIPAKGHKLTTTVSDEKCGEAGSVVTACSACNYKETYTISVKGHIWKDTYESKVDATCEADGKEIYKCQNCDAKNEVVLPKLGHNWGEWKVTKASTNTEKGTLTRTCSRGCTETAEIPAGGHNLVESDRTDSTCTVKGSVTYTCDVKHEGDVACGITVTVILPLAQHTITTDKIDATCSKEGYIKTYCTKCTYVENNVTIKKLAHVYTAGTSVDPTCTTSGYTPYSCACGDSYNKYDESKPATAHSLKEGASTASCTSDGTMTLTCENADCKYSTTVEVPALGHDYVEDATAATSATCAAPATKTFKCSRCTSSYTIAVGEKSTEHTYDESKWTVVESSTATSLGYKTNACTVCGQLKVETIPATGEHNFNKETERKNATCTADGYVKYACSTHTDCGLTSTVTLPKLGHTEKLEYSPATCEGKGYARRVCTVESCKEVIESTEIPALGHLYGEGTVTPATCKDSGKIEYTCTCENCGDKKSVTIATNANAHQYETVVTDSTCKTAGSVVTKCKLCDNEIPVKTLPLIEHSWNNGEIKEGDKATCINDGKTTYTCTVCSAEKTDLIAKTGHNWSAWTKTDATNDTDGKWERKCSNCQDVESVVIPKGNHNLVLDADASEDATCTAEGKKVYKCTNHENCTVKVELTLDKLQHELETSKTDATCTNEGSVVTKCSKCDTATITTKIPATGHTFNEGEKTPATCTMEGKIVYSCTAKDCTATREVTLDKLPHTYEAGTPVAATCTASGYTPYKCKDCDSNYVIITANANDHTFVKDSSDATCTNGGKMTLKCACGDSMEVEVPALGHDYVLNSATQATCAEGAKETYKCSRCEDSYTITVSGKSEAHVYDETKWTVVVDSTPTSLGYKTNACTVCGQLKVETIPATGDHKFDIETSDKKDATCTENGYIVYDCSVHKGADDCGLTSEVILPKLGHDEKLQYKAASCTEEGYAKRYCTRCDTTLKEENIAKLNHVYGNEKITLSDCKNKGAIEFTCTSCNTATKTVEIPVNANAHKLVTATENATCEKEGSVVTSCSICKTELVKTTLPKLEHNWSAWIKTDATNSKNGEWKRVCANNSDHFETLVIPAGGHSFNTSAPASTTVASCNVQGTATYNCSAHADCGVTITVNTGYAEHTYDTVLVNASCEGAGSVTTSCEVCSDVSIVTPIPATGHSYSGEVTTKPTCTTPGVKTYTCAHDENHTFVEDIAPLGHDYVKQGETTEATCTAPSTENYKCSRCEDAFTKYVSGIADHKWNDEWTVVIEATADKNGIRKTTCSECDAEKYETIAPIGDHEFTLSETIEASCDKEGSKIYICTSEEHVNCTATYTETIGKLDHTQKVVYTAPTCKTEGVSKIVCEKCGTKIAEATIPVIPHVFNSGKVTTPATCKNTGVKTYNCTTEGCTETKTEIIPVIDHVISVTVKDATCNEKGSVVTSCANCDYEIVVDLAVKGHVWNTTAQSTVEAKCDTDGSKTYKCLYCEETNTVVLSKTGHLWGDWKVVTTPTEKNPGYQERQCSVCKNYEISQIPAFGTLKHNFEIVEKVEPTCTTNGYVKRVCTDEGCGYIETETLKLLGHVLTYNEYHEPTCTLDGNYAHYHCSRCNLNFEDRAAKRQMTTVVIGMKYHALVIIAGKEATCTADGVTDYKYCTRCEYTQEATPIPATGHKDVNKDGLCDACSGKFTDKDDFVCTCSCHKTGFFNELIYKLLKFFWKLFGSNKVCECGEVHY